MSGECIEQLVSLGSRGSRWMGEMLYLKTLNTHVDGCRLASPSVIRWEYGQCNQFRWTVDFSPSLTYFYDVMLALKDVAYRRVNCIFGRMEY
jgi:hypothetical protein